MAGFPNGQKSGLRKGLIAREAAVRVNSVLTDPTVFSNLANLSQSLMLRQPSRFDRDAEKAWGILNA
jgi:hypothetical protein